MKTKQLTLCGILTAVSLTIFVLEAQLPQLIPVPGIKPGLSNLITLFSLLYLTPGQTVLILLARILLSALVVGTPSVLLYSLVGGLGCLWAELLLLRKTTPAFIWAISGVGAICHNILQLVCAAIITQTLAVFYYLPFLLISGILTGLFTGFCIYYLYKKKDNVLRRMLR